MITNYDDLLALLDAATDTPYARHLEPESANAIRTLQNLHQTEFEYRVLNGAQVEELQAELTVLQKKVTAIVVWLEANQPDVFRRGLWDAIEASGKGNSNSDEWLKFQSCFHR